MFDFSMPFEINDDNTILKKMGMWVFFLNKKNWAAEKFVNWSESDHIVSIFYFVSSNHSLQGSDIYFDFTPNASRRFAPILSD
jgi:ABC-type glycerol-3-phosphate transport system substrate-binding protein